MKISELISDNISQYELDFVDVDLSEDCPLYIDPFLIAHSNSTWAQETNLVIKNFFDTFKGAMKRKDFTYAKELFQFMSEPKETCLGVSKKGTLNGRGVGKLNTEEILTKIIESKAIENNLVQNIEDIIIFVNDIDKDKLSDMSTNIMRKQLTLYTNEQCKLWNIKMESGETLPYWSPQKREWITSQENLLIVQGREILLVPKSIVGTINLYQMSKYKWHFVVEQEKNFHLQRNSELVRYKKLKSGKEKAYIIKSEVNDYINNDITKKQSNSKEYIRGYTQEYPDLFENFIKRCENMIKPMTNSEIANRLGDTCDPEKIIQELINKLDNIPTGKKSAYEYHKYIMGLLEVIFYPYLTNPIIEQEIHEGRKRIDIVMENNATNGFFHKLHDINKIFCPNIFFECKNYQVDVANPELDQLSGRFGTLRGSFGIMMCRNIDNKELFLSRCADTYKDGRGLIIPLTDNDIIFMLENMKEKDFDKAFRLLDTLKRKIVIK